MYITDIETLHCDAGWRPWTFIKISTDEGITGYSECTDSHGAPRGIEGAVLDLRQLLVGQDPRRVETLYWKMVRATKQTPGGLLQKAIAGIENALLDIKGKALGVPVYELLGGPLTDRVRLYWSHCGTTRVRAAQLVGVEQVRDLDDIATLGREVVAKGYSALKTNMLILDDDPYVYMPGFGKGRPDLNDRPLSELIDRVVAVIGTFRDAAGQGTDICLDLNFNLPPAAVIQMAKQLEPFKLLWLEYDNYDPVALRRVRDAVTVPVCSGENLYTPHQYRPFFENQAMDIAMIDVPWNGLLRSKHIADSAGNYDMLAAPHNYYSHLATFISAHFAALTPNTRILEVDVDDVPWKDALVTNTPRVEQGFMLLDDAPGWGADLDEQVLKQHPWPE